MNQQKNGEGDEWTFLVEERQESISNVRLPVEAHLLVFFSGLMLRY